MSLKNKNIEDEIFKKNKKALEAYDEEVIAKYQSTIDEERAKDPQAEDVKLCQPKFLFLFRHHLLSRDVSSLSASPQSSRSSTWSSDYKCHFAYQH